jgi:hypothetical protein
MKIKMLFALGLLVPLSAWAAPQLPYCQDNSSTERARYVMGIAFAADMAAQSQETSLPNSEICLYVGSATTDLATYMSLLKVLRLSPTIDQAGRLMEAQSYASAINSFCTPVAGTGGLVPPVGFGDRAAVAQIGKDLADVAIQILQQDVGCIPNHP